MHFSPLINISQAFSVRQFQLRPRTVVVAIAAVILARWIRGNYKAYLALGKGALPANPLGYCIAMMAIPFGRECVSTACYDQDDDKSTWIADPDNIPQRKGERPTMGWHFLPHRQTNQFPPQEIKDKLAAIFARHAAANCNIVDVRTSPHERVHDGIIIAESVPSPHKVADLALREIVHLHPEIDYSLHVVLSPQDSKLVIERAWGQRHPLSGTRHIPKEYILVYAPRNEEELSTVERILMASIAYMTGEREVR